MSRIFIASDHAGFSLKEHVIETFQQSNITLTDLGCTSTDSVDYPDFAQKLSQNITQDSDVGILICGSGIGISIAANRSKHIRAALCHNSDYAKLARAHNNANVICLGARMIQPQDAFDMINTFLNTEFEDGRHAKRVNKLAQ